MRYQNIQAFKKHLAGAAKVSLAPVFLLVSACSYERRSLVQTIISAISAKEGEIDFSSKESGVKELIQELETHALVGGKRVIYLNHVEKLKKQDLDFLVSYVERPCSFAYLILGATSTKNLAALNALAKKELVICDIAQEKPWERKERLKEMLAAQAGKEKKTLHRDALDSLFQKIGADLPSLLSELEKLITYVGQNPEIRLQDVQQLCVAKTEMKPWQLADEIVWKDTCPLLENQDEMLFALMPQLYSQLQQGLILSLSLEQGMTRQGLSHHFPDIKQANLEKMILVAKERGSHFFKEALSLVFDMELRAKNSGSDPALLLDLLVAKLLFLKRYDLLAT